MAGAGGGGKTVPFADQEPIGGDTQGGMMVKTAPLAFFKAVRRTENARKTASISTHLQAANQGPMIAFPCPLRTNSSIAGNITFTPRTGVSRPEASIRSS